MVAEIIQQLPNIKTPHGFFAMQNDETEIKYQNIAKTLGLSGYARAKQIHSANVITVTAPGIYDDTDALVTKEPDIMLAINTADCAPILLFDPKASVIAVVHAGWRGAIGGVIQNALEVMFGMGCVAGDICAAIGPAIHQKNYEISNDFYDNFIAQSADNKRFFQRIQEKQYFDLPGYCLNILRQLRVGSVLNIGIDTYSSPAFASHRRNTHQNHSSTLRNVSVIGLSR